MLGETNRPNAGDDLAMAQALFPGLVYNQVGEEAAVVMVGGVAHYVILDDGFARHTQAYMVDDQVIAALQEQILSMRETLVQGMLQMMGTDDILTKAAVEAMINNMGEGIRRSDPSQWAPLLKVYGFRIVVNVHGQVVEIQHPQAPGAEDEE